MMMWVLLRVPTVYTHITLLLLCVTYDDVGVVSSTHSLHPHHFNNNFVKMCCCGYSKQHQQHHTITHFVNVVVVCHL